MNEGAGWDPMLLKAILKPMITYTYIKNSLQYWDLTILRLRDLVVPCLIKVAITRYIFAIQGSSFVFSPAFMCSKNHILQLRLYDQFKKNHFLLSFFKKFVFDRKSQEVSKLEV